MIEIKRVENLQQIQKVEALGRIIWIKHYTPINGLEHVEYMLKKFQSESAISEQIRNGYEYYLVYNAKEAVGYFSIEKRGSTLFLSKFYVLESQRGKGLGKHSMNFIYDRAEALQCNSITLTVNKYNTDSIRAYEKMGFKTIEALVVDIGGGHVMDDYKMQKELLG